MSGIFSKIKSTFEKASDKLSVVLKIKKIDLEQVADVETALLKADFGVETTEEILKIINKSENAAEAAKKYIKDVLSDFESDLLERKFDSKPYVIMVIGVNGNGKTTTVAKLANYFKNCGLNPRIAACDTFRAAATEQLFEWSKKIGCDITIGKANSDPSGVAYSAYKESENNDVLIIDTAGRLHTRKDLMDELLKTKRVIKKLNSDAPHETVIILDGTTGQAAFSQISAFKEAIGIDSVVVTKLDSSSKGGAIVGIAKQYSLPIAAICFGEQLGDLSKFSASEYAESIFE